MCAGSDDAESVDRELGAELVRAAELVMARVDGEAADTALAVQLATTQILFALYWELRHQRPGRLTDLDAGATPDRLSPASVSPDTPLEWASALLCSVLSSGGRPSVN